MLLSADANKEPAGKGKRKMRSRAYIVIEPAAVEDEFLAAPIDGEDVGQGCDGARGQQLVREIEHFRQRFRVVLRAIMFFIQKILVSARLGGGVQEDSNRWREKGEANPRERSAGGARCRVLLESDMLRHKRARVARPYKPCSP